MVKSVVKASLRVCLVSTSSLWIAGFQGMFGDPCGVDAYAVTLREALALKGKQVVLIDVTASSVEGRLREVLLQFRQWAPDLLPIVISHEHGADDQYIEELIRAGAKGYLDASSSSEKFGAALQTVQEGALWAPRKVLSRLVLTVESGGSSSLSHRGASDEAKLAAGGSKLVVFTPREDEVIRMLVGGRDNREIGARLGMHPITVKSHLGRMMRKAGVANRIELTMFALKRRGSRGLGVAGASGLRGV